MNKIHVTVVSLILGLSSALGIAAATDCGRPTGSRDAERLQCGDRGARHEARQGREGDQEGAAQQASRRFRPFPRRALRAAPGRSRSCSSARHPAPPRATAVTTTTTSRTTTTTAIMATAATTTTTAETMTSQVGRLYSVALALFVFFLTWVVIGARPWVASGSESDPRLAALEKREQRVRRESVAVQRLVKRRWATYRAQLAGGSRRSRPPTRHSWRRAGTVGSRREPAAGHVDEDVVMESRRFKAMGTEIELLVEADGAERRTRRRRARVPPARGDPDALPARVRALPSQRGAVARGGPRPARGRPARTRGARADRRALRPDRPRRRRRRRATTARSSERSRGRPGVIVGRVCGGAVRIDGLADRARAPASVSTSAGSARATPPSAPPSCCRRPARASSTRAATSPCTAARGPSASRRPRAS